MGLAREVQKALMQRLREDPELSDLTVHIGDGDGIEPQLRREIVFLNFTTSTQYTVLADGAHPTEAEGTLSLLVNAKTPGLTAEEAVDDAERITDRVRIAVATAMASRPVLDVDGLYHLLVVRDQAGWQPETEGWAGLMQLTIEFKASL